MLGSSRKDTLSSYAKRLLTREPRSSAVEPPPPVDEPFNPFVLLDFASKCKKELLTIDYKVNEDSIEIAEDYVSDSDTGDDSDKDNDENRPVTKAVATDTATSDKFDRRRVVLLKNLPYSASVKSVEQFCDGFAVESVVLPADPLDAQGRPAGFAIVTFLTKEDASSAAEALNKTMFQGREVRTKQSQPGTSTARLQNASRYFVPATEALKAGAQHGFHGHGQNPKRHPCFLCAQEGHQATDCPQSVCFRCQRSGHGAKDCPPRRWGRLTLCALCGDDRHGTGECGGSRGGREAPSRVGALAFVLPLLDGADCLTCRFPHKPWPSLLVCPTSVACNTAEGTAAAADEVVDLSTGDDAAESSEESEHSSTSSAKVKGHTKKRRKEAKKQLLGSRAAAKAELLATKQALGDVYCASCGEVGHWSCNDNGAKRGGDSSHGGDDAARAKKRMRTTFEGGGGGDDKGEAFMKCFQCQGRGHIARDCPKARQDGSRNNSGNSGNNSRHHGSFADSRNSDMFNGKGNGGGGHHRGERGVFFGRIDADARHEESGGGKGTGKGWGGRSGSDGGGKGRKGGGGRGGGAAGTFASFAPSNGRRR